MRDAGGHSHRFLGHDHRSAETRASWVIWLCALMMVVEIGGGLAFGSIALVADGMHMSTHVGALLLAALAYAYARKHVDDQRFTFGTGKLGDLAGFTSAIILACIALLIGYESVARVFAPVPIRFAEAIPIACLGLAVNVASAWILSGGDHRHDGGDHHHHGHADGHDASHRTRSVGGESTSAPARLDRDNNMRAAVVHVAADAVVSVLVIVGLLLARAFGWLWMDPLAGFVGALVIASWALGLVRDTGAILLDMNPDHALSDEVRRTIEDDGDRVVDLHLWRLGPGHLGAILAVMTRAARSQTYYRSKLARFHSLSHVTIEVHEA